MDSEIEVIRHWVQMQTGSTGALICQEDGLTMVCEDDGHCVCPNCKSIMDWFTARLADALDRVGIYPVSED